MEMTAEKIAQLISGEIEGSNQKTVSGFQGIENAQEGDLTYVESEKYVSFIQTTKASVIIVSKTLSLVNIRTDSTLIRCENPRMAIARLLTIYQEAQFKSDGISTDSKVDQTAKIGSDASIGAGTIVEYGTTVGNNAILRSGSYVGKNVTIGKNVHLHSGARILDGTVIGDNVTIQANAIIGGDGFGFVPNSENNYFKVPHVGNVIIEDHVEIGAGTCIDRATMGSTIIRKGVKLDNLIQIAHNVEIGENTVIAAQTGIAGSAIIGKNCLIGGQVGIVGHIKIADEVKIAAQSGIGKSIDEKGAIYQGSPAFKIRDYKMSYVGFRKLPEILRQINVLEKRIDEQTNM